MATRNVLRHVQRRFSSSGKILSEEEKAAENVYIKLMDYDSEQAHPYFLKEKMENEQKTEQEKLEKLARKGPKAEENPEPSSGGSGSVPDAKPSESTSSSTSGLSNDKHRNYAVVAGVVTGVGALAWYLKTRGKKTEEVQD